MNAQSPVLRTPHSKSAFTLIELMVSIAVLGLLGGMVMQLLGSASRLTTNSRKTGDCDTEARFVMDQISADLSRRVRRPDVDAFVGKEKGDDRLYFFAETPGYSPTLSPQDRSTISLVGYRIQAPATEGGRFTLQRYARALPWESKGNEIAMPFVALTGNPLKPLPATTLMGSSGNGGDGSFPRVLAGNKAEDIYYQTIGENIVRFEISLLRKPDLSNPTRPKNARLLLDSETPKELAEFGFSNISALVISIAVVDTQAGLRVSQATINALELGDTDSAVFPKYPLDQWNQAFQSKSSSLPKALSNGIRFYQRAIQM